MFAVGSIITCVIVLAGALLFRWRGTPLIRRARPALAAVVAIVLATVLVLVGGSQGASAIATAVPLGTAGSYSVLAGQTVTNTGPSVLSANVGVSPGSAIIGFPPGIVLGTLHAADAAALQAQSDLTIAYNDAAGQTLDVASVSGDLGGQTLAPGIYNAASSIGLTGTLTLDAENDPGAVWVFQVGSTLTTAPGSVVAMINGATPCNVFWQIGSSATLDTSSSFIGTIMALTSISMNNGATLQGRALARNGSVTLNNNTITDSNCAVVPPTTTTTTPVATNPDGTPVVTNPDGTPVVTNPDGTPVVTNPDGTPVTSTTLGTPMTPPTSVVGTAPTDLTLPSTGRRDAQGTAILATGLLVLGAGVAFAARRKTTTNR